MHIDEVVSLPPSPTILLSVLASYKNGEAFLKSSCADLVAPEQFDLMDMKKKGYLNSYEFRHSLAALGFDLPKPTYFKHLESYGSIPADWPSTSAASSCPVNRLIMPLDQFRLCAARLILDRDPREEAAKVFNMFDYDQDGIISLDDMRRLAQDIKEERAMSDEEIQGMIEYLDHDGKGGVNLEEFIQMMEEAG